MIVIVIRASGSMMKSMNALANGSSHQFVSGLYPILRTVIMLVMYAVAFGSVRPSSIPIMAIFHLSSMM